MGFLGIAIVSIASPYDLEMWEGPIFLPAQRLVAGEAIYGAEVVLKEPYAFAGYGPLYYALVGMLLHATGVTFWPGRLLSALATVGTAILLFRAISHLTRDRVSALVASALFLSMPPAWIFGALQRVDALACFWAMSCVYVLLKHAGAGRWMILAGIFAGLAFATKQSAIAAGCVAIIWCLAVRQSRSLVSFLVGLALVMVSLAVVLLGTHNEGFLFNQTLIARNQLRSWVLFVIIRSFMQNPAAWVCVVFAALAVWRWRVSGDRNCAVIFLYLVCAVAVNGITASKIGASVNHLFELSTALALCAGVEAHRWLVRERGDRQLAAAVLSLGLVISMAAFNVGSYRHRVLDPAAKAGLHERVVEELKRLVPVDQPVASEYPDLVLRSGRRLFFNDLFIFEVPGAPEARGVWSDALARRELGAVVTLASRDLPGYVRVESIGYRDLPWATTRGYEGPLLYLREDLYQKRGPAR